MGKMEARMEVLPVWIAEKRNPLDQTTWPVQIIRVMARGEARLSAKDRTPESPRSRGTSAILYARPASCPSRIRPAAPGFVAGGAAAVLFWS
jgi:hypothetical protein